MKKTLARVLAMALCAMLLLSACESTDGDGTTRSGSTQSADSIKDLVYPIIATAELETFNVLYSQRGEDSVFLCQIHESLLETNPYGELMPALAESWGSDDGGVTWTFNLREGLKWADVDGNEKGDLIARDFATAMEWILNFHKNESTNTTMPIEMLAGAEEYYEYTKELTEEEAYALNADEGSKFLEMVGMEIPDDRTVIYTCFTNKPYFDSLGTYACMYPISQAMIDELGGPANVAAVNNKNMWYSGCYLMPSYIQGNEKVLVPNPLYWDTECDRFDTLTYRMVESADVIFQLYQSGDVDHCDLSESNLTNIYNNEDHPLHDYLVPGIPNKYSYQIHFNFDKNKEDGTPDTNWNTAAANKAFRQAWYYGLDLTNYWKRTNAITPLVCENNFYTMRGLVYTSEGKDYTELVRDYMGLPQENQETVIRLDNDKFTEYKAQAMEELEALGVTFPVGIDHYIAASSQTALDTANVLKQSISDCLGDDFAVLNIKTYVSSVRQEVINPRLQSIALNGWGADYGDPQNYLAQETYGNDNAYYSAIYSCINNLTEETEATKDLLASYKEYTKMVEDADKITTDMDKRYDAYAKAEAFMLENCFVIPLSYSRGWSVSKVDISSRMFGIYGSQNDKAKNWKTNVNGYTTEEAYANNAARDAAKK